MIRVEDLPPPDLDRQRLISAFTNLTGYGNAEILSFSSFSQLFLTRNGGLYRLGDGEIEHLKGPSPDPSERI